MQQSITQPQKIMKVRHLQQKWMDLEINFVSLAFAQFKLLCHVPALRVSSGLSTLVLTLRTNNEARASTPSTHSLQADAACELLLHW